MSVEIETRMACYRTGQLLERALIMRWLRDHKSIDGAARRFAGQESPDEICTALADAIERGEHEP